MNEVGTLSGDQNPEMTGTGEGELYGFFPGLLTSSFIARLDKTSGAELARWNLEPPTGAVQALRLLVYVAWSDGEIAPEEYDYLLAMARKQHVPDDELAYLEAVVRDPSKVVKPDIEMLKPFRAEVLEQVQGLIEADEHVAESEVDVLHRIARMLS